jgi:coniferyl-aldehyde dehydrogenase
MSALPPSAGGAGTRERLLQVLQAQRAAFLAQQPVSLKEREDRLDRGLAMLVSQRERLVDAVMTDFPTRSRPWTLLAEIFAPVQVFQGARKSVRKWMAPEVRQSPMPFRLFGARSEIHYQPLGAVGIMGAWNGPLNLVMVPLATALAAGNRAMLCPSDLMPTLAEALEQAVQAYFDDTEVFVARGGLDVSKAFSSLPFDHLLFTGSPGVGAAVATQAAPNLTPVTLELGGKCPVVIAPDADLEDAARQLVATKTMNGGQACLGPDLLFVPEAQADALIAQLDRAARALYPGAVTHPDYCGLVSERHYRRVDSLLEEAQASGARVERLGVDGEAQVRDAARHRLALHVVIDPPTHTRAMREEIFGPVMTLVRYRDLDQACAAIRAMDKPLGLYVFGKSAQTQRHILERTFSGGVTVNDVLFHYSVPDLPFGGVGRSGMGAYSFGVHGFRRFSHARSVYHQAGPRSLMGVLQPPYGRLFDLVIRGSLDRLAGKLPAAGAPPRDRIEKV